MLMMDPLLFGIMAFSASREWRKTPGGCFQNEVPVIKVNFDDCLVDDAGRVVDENIEPAKSLLREFDSLYRCVLLGGVGDEYCNSLVLSEYFLDVGIYVFGHDQS